MVASCCEFSCLSAFTAAFCSCCLRSTSRCSSGAMTTRSCHISSSIRFLASCSISLFLFSRNSFCAAAGDNHAGQLGRVRRAAARALATRHSLIRCCCESASPFWRCMNSSRWLLSRCCSALRQRRKIIKHTGRGAEGDGARAPADALDSLHDREGAGGAPDVREGRSSTEARSRSSSERASQGGI